MEKYKEYDDRKDFITFAKEAIGLIPLELKFKRLSEDAVIPTYAHYGDIGMDLTATSMEYDRENDMYIYHTSLAIESDEHYGILLFPRSSNRRTDAYLCNHVGIVDSYTYRGEIILCFKNRDSLRQLARESQIVTFFNDLRLGKDINVAVLNGINEFSRLMKDENTALKMAPYKVGDRIAQMVALPFPYMKLKEFYELSNTDRGSGGFGSSGK